MNTNVLDYGAVADGKTLCTQAFQAAIEFCSKSGGGRVTVPTGAYLIGTIYLLSGVELHIEHGARVLGSSNPNDFNELDKYVQNFSCAETEHWVGKHLIIALECENIAITGNGTIDCNGSNFYGEKSYGMHFYWRYGYSKENQNGELRLGQHICFIECKNITVRDVTLTNCCCWGFFFHGCENVGVRGIKVFNPNHYANTDGIDIDCCKNVTVSDCIINTGDDAIAVRGASSRLKNPRPCEYIAISNCVLSSSACAVRVGVGDGLIRHVQISNITVESGGFFTEIMTDYGGRGHVSIEDVHFSGISASDCAFPIFVENNSSAHISNISFENITVSAFAKSIFSNLGSGCISDIRLKNVRIEMFENSKLSEKDSKMQGNCIFNAENTDGLSFENVEICADEKLLKKWKIFENIGGNVEGAEKIKVKALRNT